MDECTGRYFAKGNEIVLSSEFNYNLFSRDYSVYEVIRVINGTVLFFEEHLDRLAESVRLSQLNYAFDRPSMVNTIAEVISVNNRSVGNIKLIIHFPENRPPVTYVYFIPHYYPSSNDYAHGVATSFLKSMRVDPNIKKLVIPSQSLTVGSVITPVYEYLLVDGHGNITEGSKSNVFFIKGNSIVTAPDELVLKGITREKIFNIIKYLNYNFITKPVSVNNLSNIKTAFLTGTSLGVLPIQYIGEKRLQVDNPILRKIMKEYDKMVEDYPEYSLKK